MPRELPGYSPVTYRLIFFLEMHTFFHSACLSASRVHGATGLVEGGGAGFGSGLHSLLTSRPTLDKLYNLSESQFPRLQSRTSRSVLHWLLGSHIG